MASPFENLTLRVILRTRAESAGPFEAESPPFRLPRPPLVPLMVAGITVLAYGVVQALWPPKPTLLLAALASYALARNRGQEPGGAILTALLSTLVTVAIIWVIVLVVGAFAVIDCLSPNGGCIPW